MPRGLYNQKQGDEHRFSQAAVQEHYDDNESIEGPVAAVIRRMMDERKHAEVDAYVDKLRSQEWSQTRIEAVLSKAMLGMKF
tara:strand:+ start:1054 stop:1299 length:246 start_codon:yes stop_codon:yes gene_type:complete